MGILITIVNCPVYAAFNWNAHTYIYRDHTYELTTTTETIIINIRAAGAAHHLKTHPPNAHERRARAQ